MSSLTNVENRSSLSLNSKSLSVVIKTISENLNTYSVISSLRPSLKVDGAKEIAYLEKLDDQEFLACLEDVKIKMRDLELENLLFKNFLMANEPSLLSGLGSAKKMIAALEQLVPLSPLQKEDINSHCSRGYPMFSEQGIRIKYSLRSDLVSRATVEKNQAFEKWSKKALRKKARYCVEIEEASIRLGELIASIEYFNQSVVEAVDPITQRIAAEKFSWYMNEWLKITRITVEKLRRTNGALKVQLKKHQHVYTQKVEVGECLTEIDIEQLQLLNQNLKAKIEQLTIECLQLRSMQAKSQLLVVEHKNYLHKLICSVKIITNAVSETIESTKSIEKEIIRTKPQIEQWIKEYKLHKHLIESYKAPEVIEYVKVKENLQNMKKTLKVLDRRDNILNIQMNSNLNGLKRLTRTKKAKKEWFRRYEGEQNLMLDNFLKP